ncbi:MFS transporter [Mobiluncus mulieris]|uniref:MFS transporter n=1 Tax=Mobiluncus mulieris TaxID=2052 RepID=A0A7Y0TZ91_9ACTO|nr:MFS transporter [Mobiluncus mulieris]NMW64050.1 MFS transporter [Mobiluncus mulieris]
MREKLKNLGFTTNSFLSLVLITVNAQLIYAFWDIRNTIPKDFPAAMGVTDAQAGNLYSMQGLVILLGTIALGWIGDRFSIRTIMLISSVGAGGISLFITMFSPNLSLGTLLVCFFLMLLFTEVLFKPANFKAVRLSTTEAHQGTAFGFFEFGRGLLAFLVSLLWTVMVASGASARIIMYTSSIIVLVAGLMVFWAVPKGQKVGDDDTQASNTLEAIKGVGKVAKLPIVWLTGINVFCIYGTFVAAGTYFARFLQAGYGASALAAATFATVVIGLRMLPLVSTILVEKVFKSTAKFMRTLEITLVVLLLIIAAIFFTNHPAVSSYPADKVPDDLVSSGTFWILVVVMLAASATTFMIRGVYYAPIGEFGVEKKNSSAAMSFAITLGYIPALLAPIALGSLITPSVKDESGTVVTEMLTSTSVLGSAFLGLACLALVAAIMSHVMVRMQSRKQKVEAK